MYQQHRSHFQGDTEAYSRIRHVGNDICRHVVLGPMQEQQDLREEKRTEEVPDMVAHPVTSAVGWVEK